MIELMFCCVRARSVMNCVGKEWQKLFVDGVGDVYEARSEESYCIILTQDADLAEVVKIIRSSFQTGDCASWCYASSGAVLVFGPSGRVLHMWEMDSHGEDGVRSWCIVTELRRAGGE